MADRGVRSEINKHSNDRLRVSLVRLIQTLEAEHKPSRRIAKDCRRVAWRAAQSKTGIPHFELLERAHTAWLEMHAKGDPS